MTERAGNEPGSALFARIQQIVSERGVGIRLALNGNALRLEFADGQRILVTFDPHSGSVWLAARSGGTEFSPSEGSWHAADRGEFFASLRELVEQTIASNPLNALPAAHAPTLVHTEPVARYETRKSHALRNLLIVMLAAAVGYWVAQRPEGTHHAGSDATPAQAKTVSLDHSDAGPQCDAGFPGNGSVTVFPDGGLRAAEPNDSEITIKNDHAHPVLLTLTAPQSVIPLMSVLVHARQRTAVRVPTGQYGILSGVGSAWCNSRQGFSDGHFLKFDRTLSVDADRPVRLLFQSSGMGTEDIQLFVSSAVTDAPPPQPTFSGDGSMEVPRHANGHFYVPGTIENVPVTFMVDTGATVTSISDELARSAGIRNCRQVQFQTANGAATGCLALVARMTLGNFELQNITVAVMPNLDANLLGANVLRNFQVSQRDNRMLIGRN